MKLDIRTRMTHMIITFLLTAGVLMPVLGSLDASLSDPRMLLASLIIIVSFELLAVRRISAIAGIITGIIGTAVWLLSMPGARILSDFTVAVSLRLRGIDTALPLIDDSTKIIITILVTVLCCFACVKKATCLPPLVLCLAAVLAVWMTNRTEMIPWLLCALTAMTALLMMSRYSETPFIRLVPWTAGIVCLSFLLSGNGATIPSLKEKTDEMRRSILDRLFFTEARDVFSLYTVGYSPQGPDQLGGKPNPNDEPVMTVLSPLTVYLRGTVYDEYTGRSWINNAGGRRYLWQSERMEKERKELFDTNLPPEEIQNTLSREYTVTVQMESESTSTLFLPQRIRELIPGTNMVPYYSNSSEIFITRNLKAGDTYSVKAPLYTSDDPGIGSLVEICGQSAGKSGNVRLPDIYLNLPAHLEPSLKALALDITRDAKTSFEKAYAIQLYLKDNFEYSTDVEDQPPEYDFVTTFLMTSRKGYCTYFASAMTVLCRLNGLPARYVEGYLAEPDSTGKTILSGMNAHAWTEVYFQGFGWLTFDATPGERNGKNAETNVQDKKQSDIPEETPAPSPTPTPAPAPTPTPTPSPATEPSPESRPTPTPPSQEDLKPSPDPANTITPESSENNDHSVPSEEPQKTTPERDRNDAGPEFPWLIVPILMIIILILRIVLTSPSVKAKFAGSDRKAAGIWIQEITDVMAAEHITRKSGETPLGFSERIDRTGIYSVNMRPVGEIISVMSYSRSGITAESVSTIRDTAVILKSEISKPAKARYWIRRIFLLAKGRKRYYQRNENLSKDSNPSIIK